MQSSFKKTLGIAFLFILLLAGNMGLGWLAWTIQGEKERAIMTSDIVGSINKKLATSQNILDLKEVFPYSWSDKVYIFPPYTSAQNIKSVLNLDWQETSIEKRDDVNLVIFVEGNQVKRYLLYPRSYGDFFQNQSDKRYITGTVYRIAAHDGIIRLSPEG